MPRYYFDLLEGDLLAVDEEGQELSSLREVQARLQGHSPTWRGMRWTAFRLRRGVGTWRSRFAMHLGPSCRSGSRSRSKASGTSMIRTRRAA